MSNYDELVRLARLGKRSEQRSKAVAGCLGLLAKSTLLWVSHAAIRGWLFMLAVGVVHHDWFGRLPTIGFWSAFVLMLLFAWALPGSAAKSTPKLRGGESL